MNYHDPNYECDHDFEYWGYAIDPDGSIFDISECLHCGQGWEGYVGHKADHDGTFKLYPDTDSED